MVDPVILPKGKQRIDRSSIVQHLLSDPVGSMPVYSVMFLTNFSGILSRQHRSPSTNVFQVNTITLTSVLFTHFVVDGQLKAKIEEFIQKVSVR